MLECLLLIPVSSSSTAAHPARPSAMGGSFSDDAASSENQHLLHVDWFQHIAINQFRIDISDRCIGIQAMFCHGGQ